MPDAGRLAADLADVTRDLDEYIHARARDLAEGIVATVEHRSGGRIAELERDLAAARQRFEDLRREIRRQEAPWVRLEAKARADAATLRRVALLKYWTNEDGRRFVFADDLEDALKGETVIAGGSGV